MLDNAIGRQHSRDCNHQCYKLRCKLALVHKYIRHKKSPDEPQFPIAGQRMQRIRSQKCRKQQGSVEQEQRPV